MPEPSKLEVRIADVVDPMPEFFVSREQGGINTQRDAVFKIVEVLALYRRDPAKGCLIGRYGVN